MGFTSFLVSKRDKLDGLPERIPPKTLSYRFSPEEHTHDKTNSRDSYIGAISDSAIGSSYKHTINNVLSDMLAALPAMRRLNHRLLQNIQFLYLAVSQYLPELSRRVEKRRVNTTA